MKDDFLATTSHELRTPLHGIMGLTESMLRSELGQINEAQKENLKLIRESAGHLTGLVNEILDFSKLRSGKADIFLEKTRIADIAATVVSLMKHSAAQKGLNLELDAKASPEITADRRRLRQILINLVGNAIKFTDTGEIRLIVESADKGGVRITVRDTGCGINKNDLARIWNPFEQAENPDIRRSGGTGLGLPIAKHLVELHGGAIHAESVPGEGTSFIVELPATPPMKGIQKSLPDVPTDRNPIPAHAFTMTSSPAEAGEEKNYRPRRNIATAKILAVDDDPINLRVIEHICRVAGYSTATAPSGTEALQILAEQNIDLVLLDLMLPGMSGFEVCQKMRADESLQNVPIIMVTARDTAADLIKGFATGANDYITKPFNREELLVRIENQLVIKQMLDMEKSVSNGLRIEKDSITNLYQRSQDLKESTLQMLEWERIVREDINIAHSFQMKLMTHAKNITGLESSIIYQPILKLGGDIYDIFEIRPGVARVFLADATGHGITASLNTVKILSEYATMKDSLPSPREVVSLLNRRFCALYDAYHIVFTCVVADIDTIEETVTVATAGHPECYLLSGGSVSAMKPRGPIVGFSETYEYPSQTHPFKQGDIILLYTDGLIDLVGDQHGGARNPDFNVWEKIESRIKRINTVLSLDEIIASVIQPPADERLSRGRAEDDITIITIRRV
jgi:two-component system sensor histidine kinase ChiS